MEAKNRLEVGRNRYGQVNGKCSASKAIHSFNTVYQIRPPDKSVTTCLSQITYSLPFPIIDAFPTPSYTLRSHSGTGSPPMFIPSPFPLGQKK